MNFRMKLNNDHEDKPRGNEHYTEGYNAGYNNAMEEMRRRTRGYAAPLDNEHHMPMDGIGWPLETRQIGFTGEPPRQNLPYTPQSNRPPHTPPMNNDPMDTIMNMLHEVKQGQEHIKQGMAYAKKLDPRLEGVLESATKVLENPPSTWAQYQHRKDYAGIAKMEGKELLAALEAKKPIQDIRKELTHTIAALFQLVSAQ